MAEKQKLASNLSRSDALAMELQSRLEEKEERGCGAQLPIIFHRNTALAFPTR